MPSIAQLEKLLALDPADAFVLYGLAMEHAKSGQIDHAMTYFDRCTAADPAYCYAYFHKARVQSEAGRTSDAIETLNRGLIAAKAAGDAHAMSEMRELLDQL
ncbi:MAG: tetratricopeptide repeat protein, partial [Phycisphaerae bacterium]|nr:tetratricopeptide repeat protein [Phycisphaerae bacterium]